MFAATTITTNANATTTTTTLAPSPTATKPFCTGADNPYVMQSGFMLAFGPEQPCVLFLFPGWGVDTAGKYAAAVIAAFLMAFSIEALGYFRKWLVREHVLRPADRGFFLTSILYMVQMLMAYWIMLLVMLYETAFFCALLCGYGCGNAYFSVYKMQQQLKEKEEKKKAVAKNGESYGATCETCDCACESCNCGDDDDGKAVHAPCCGGVTEESALI